MKAARKLNVEVTRRRFLQTIDAVQYDTGVQIVLTVKDLTIPSGTTARVFFKKPSGKFVYQDAVVSGNVVTIDVHNQALTEYGNVTYQVRLANGADIVTTFSGKIEVQPSLADSSATTSETVVPAFDAAVQSAVTEIESARDGAIAYIGQGLDDTLSVEGKAADAKATGAAVAELKGDIVFNGLYAKGTVFEAGFGEPYKIGYVYSSRNSSQIGKTLEDMYAVQINGSKVYLIDISDAKKVLFRTFKTSEKSGSYILDENKTCIQELTNEVHETGTEVEYTVDDGGKYLLYSVSSGLYNTGLDIFIKITSGGELNRKVDETILLLENAGDDLSKSVNLTSGYIITNGEIGTVVDLTQIKSPITKSSVTDCIGFKYVVINGVGGQLARLWAFVDDDNVLLAHADDSMSLHNAVLEIPNGATKIIINSTSEDVSYVGIPKIFLYEEIKKKDESASDIFQNENRNLCMCAIRTQIDSNKVPYASGYLFHRLANDDGTLFYGTNFNNITEIGKLNIKPTNCMIACSPKDGRMIFTRRNMRGTMYIWDGDSLTELFVNADFKPMGWLYNSGVEFTNDESGNEICLFAEYTNAPGVYATNGYRVWRGVYPYTSESDWSIVFSQNYGSTPLTDITHFHQVRRDPWTEVLYLTSGDDSALSKWWYSTDFGITWTLLTDGQSSGFEEHICRCINFIFTKDWIYFATDKGTNHCLNKIARNVDTGIIDTSTRLKICDLPEGRATNSICYVDAPKGIFMYDRVDIGYDEYYDKGFDVQFWSIDDSKLYTLMHIDLTSNTWGGHRGKCYLNYVNSVHPYPAMGFSIDTPCMFDIVSDDVSKIGTVYYEVFNRVLHTLIIL